MSKKTKIGLIGFGVVNSGLAEIILQQECQLFEIKKIAVKNPNKKRDFDAKLFTFQASEVILDPEIEIIVEAIDDAEVAAEYVRLALNSGKHVVSANKKMLAYNAHELIQLAKEKNVALLYEASSCGVIPVIELLDNYFSEEPISKLRGIFNGTSNYILSKVVNEGLAYNVALKCAQDLGFAESNPESDVSGSDANYKLSLLSRFAFGVNLNPDEVLQFGIENIDLEDLKYAQHFDSKIKLVPTAIQTSKGIIAWVGPQFVSKSDPLFAVDNENNALDIDTIYSKRQQFIGKGAGGIPTGSALYKNLLQVSKEQKYAYSKIDSATSSDELIVEVYIKLTSVEQLSEFKFTNKEFIKKSDSGISLTAWIPISELKKFKSFQRTNSFSLIFTGNYTESFTFKLNENKRVEEVEKSFG